MDYVAYLRERACEFRNLALTTRDAATCQALHDLANLCTSKAAMLAAAPPRDSLSPLTVERGWW